MLPNVLVIGAQKAGTSSLHRYLDLHPEIGMSSTKELNFFQPPFKRSRAATAAYAASFPAEAPVRGESSPTYTRFPHIRGVPERIHALIPETRLIYMVRDPIERLISEYLHYATTARERRPLEQVLLEPLTPYPGAAAVRRLRRALGRPATQPFTDHLMVATSSYRRQLEQYLRLFPPGRILVLAQEDLHDERRATLARAFRFLGVDEHFTSSETEILHNVSSESSFPAFRRATRPLLRMGAGGRGGRRIPGVHRLDARLSRPARRPALSSEMRDRLREVLAPEAEWLRNFSGERFESWSV